MKYGPDIAIVAQLLGDPARANMVMALMSGQALSAAELAHEAGVTPPTATGHLSKLVSLGLLKGEKQGRHRFFQLCDPDVGEAVEALIAVAARAGHLRTRPVSHPPRLLAASIHLFLACHQHLRILG